MVCVSSMISSVPCASHAARRPSWKPGLGQDDADVGQRRLGQHAGDLPVGEQALDGPEVVELAHPRGQRRVDGGADVARARPRPAAVERDEGLVDGPVVAVAEDEHVRALRERAAEPQRPAVGVGRGQREAPPRHAEAPARAPRRPTRRPRWAASASRRPARRGAAAPRRPSPAASARPWPRCRPARSRRRRCRRRPRSSRRGRRRRRPGARRPTWPSRSSARRRRASRGRARTARASAGARGRSARARPAWTAARRSASIWVTGATLTSSPTASRRASLEIGVPEGVAALEGAHRARRAGRW